MDKVSFKIKLLLGFLSAILIFLSFPPVKAPFMSIIGLATYFLLISDFKNFKKGLILSIFTGFVLGFLFLYWLYYPIHNFYNAGLMLSILAVIPAALVFSIYHFATLYSLLYLTHYITERRYKTLLLAPFIWVFFEVLREFIIFNGFPWDLMGYSISYINTLAQITSLFGIYFLSLVVLLWSVMLSWLLIHLIEKAPLQKFNYLCIAMSILIFIGLIFYGSQKIKSYKDEGIPKKVALIQGNIPQEEKMHVKFHKKINDEYIELINKIDKKVDMIIIPESSIYILPSLKDNEYTRFFNKLKIKDTPILAGLDDIILTKNKDIKVYNSIYLFSPNGEILGTYRKIKLVPIGEYTPKLLGLLKRYINYLGGIDLSFGEEKKIIKYKEFKIVPFICFESIFPYFVGDFAKNGNLLVNITNDAWFGDTTAPYQHFEMARVRAIENGKYLVRVANSGITAVVNPIGEIKLYLPLFVREIAYADVYLIDKQTFFEEYISYIYAFYIIFPIFFFLLLIAKNSNREI